jgi:predicted PurR-regulated permease PerM
VISVDTNSSDTGKVGIADDDADHPARATRGAAPDESSAAVDDAQRARDEAEAAERKAESAEDAAEASAARADNEAQAAEQSAEVAEHAADEAETIAEVAAEQATAAALEADGLLLSPEAQQVAAQASDEAPFGLPGRPIDRRSPVRQGFLIAVGVLLAVAAALTVRALESELMVILTAAFIAIGLNPVVTWLAARGLPRWLAVLTISVVSAGLLAAFLAAAVPPLVNEANQLINHGPQLLQQLQDQHSAIGQLNAKFHIEAKLQSAASQNLSFSSFGGLLKVGEAIASFTLQAIIVIVLVLYILADFEQIKRVFYRLAPLPRRPRVALLGDEILARTGGYILGNLLTSLIAIICQYAILRILGVPYALVLSVFVGILDLVPLVGSTVAGILVTIVALAAVSLPAAIINVVFTIAYRLAEDYLISPRILRRTVDVRPIVTVVAVFLGGALLGIVGALMAVPAAAAIQLIVTEVIYPRTDNAR